MLTAPTTPISINLPVMDQLIRDVLNSCVYGGSNYWAEFEILETHVDEDDLPTPQHVRVHDHGDSVEVLSSRDISLSEVREGIRVLLTASVGDKAPDGTLYQNHQIVHKGTREHVYTALVSGKHYDIDIDGADAILQYAFFGHIVYG